jgi:DNA-directed RNA polymerase subunit RPC12/RpoP
MSWRFRQSFKIIPGLKLNLSRSGLSTSIGGSPFTVNLGPRGLYATASVPGTGISFRQRLGAEPGRPQQTESYEPSPSPIPSSYQGPLPNSAPVQEIRSASTEILTSDSLQELKLVIQSAYEEHEDISQQLVKSREEAARASKRYTSWENGYIFKKIFKNSFASRQAEAEITSDKVSELEAQLRLTTVSTQVELANPQAERFFRLRDDFAAMAECTVIWDIKSEQATDKVRERTIANARVSRQRVKFSLESCDLIQWEQAVPHLQNANGGDLFLYPGFILYRAAKMAFSVIDFHDVSPTISRVKFQEEETVPGDSKIVGHTWVKVNKDGSRDRRFADNHEIPIVLYGELTFRSERGLWEVFQVSNPDRLEGFVKSWNDFVRSFEHQISKMELPQEKPATAEWLADSTVNAPSPVVEPQNATPPRRVGTEVHFECHKCRQPIETNADAAGQEFYCPECGEKLVVPPV